MATFVTQPVNQVRLTNVAYVRLMKGGKRFEIACYRNKVLNWRNKIEQDISEVLQIPIVFQNVSKGNAASVRDLEDVFGTSDQLVVCKEILDKGDLQVSEQERQAHFESLYRDVAAIVCDLTINPENGRPYTISMILNAMKQIHYSVMLSKSAKQQALDVIKKLKSVMAIVRASMTLRIVCRQSDVAAVSTMLNGESKSVTILVQPASSNVAGSAAGAVVVAEAPSHLESSQSQPPAEEEPGVESVADIAESLFDIRAEPEVYRRLEESIRHITNGFGRIEVLQLRSGAASGSGDSVRPATDSSSPYVVIDGNAGKQAKNELSRQGDSGNKGAADNDLSSDEEYDLGRVRNAKPASKKNNKIKAKERKAAREQNSVDSRSDFPEPSDASPVIVTPDVVVAVADGADTVGGKKCNTCGGMFDEVAYRSHFRSDWHQYNLRRKLKSLTIVSEETYNRLPAAEKNLKTYY